MYKRLLDLSKVNQTFFLWGQRQVGKSYLLRTQFPKAYTVDLLKTEDQLSYASQPSLLRERLGERKAGDLILIDEVQKVPRLLDEVHWLIENRKLKFGLCGSSARKLKRGHANLLGGRALRFELYGLTAQELGSDFELKKMLNRGYLPNHYLSEEFNFLQKSYVQDYLKEEILAEGIIRNLPQFSRFLEICALSDSEVINFSSIGRDCGVTTKTVQNYFEILVDTLVGSYVPSFLKRPKRRIIHAPKFYFHDVGTVNYLASRERLEPKSAAFGKAFENWVYHELKSFQQYSRKTEDLTYWRLSTGVEVDFIIGDMKVAIEVKSSEKINSDHLKGLRELKTEHPHLKSRILVSLEKHVRKTEDGILILPYQEFIKRLYKGEIF